ncbi:MAG: hypothetical protein GC168_03770 [Candidatus Hydrogenedens sp.]|nr:hypothetical protein [Candidatus Hydrogenedens sp.]
MLHRILPAAALVLLASMAASAEFQIDDDGQQLTIRDGGEPVAVYHYGFVVPERKAQYRLRRACYFYPLYSPSGAVITEDFPVDHLHHRGLFWAWPEAKTGGRTMDTWLMPDCRQYHIAFESRDAGPDSASFVAKSRWAFDDTPDAGLLEETVSVTFHAATDGKRPMDLAITLTNVTDAPFLLDGQSDGNKGYGGLCYRAAPAEGLPYAQRKDAEHSPYRFFTAQGGVGEDQLEFDSPWVALDAPAADERRAGAAIFQHPSLPGYPHHGWMLRHYGFLVQSWPHREPYTIEPGASVTLRYRVVLFDGPGSEAGLAEDYERFKAVD